MISKYSAAAILCRKYAASIPKYCAAFKFDASFEFDATSENYTAGQYHIVWRIELQEGVRIPHGFRIQATITYDEDPAERSGSLNVGIPEDKICSLEKGKWLDVVVPEYLIIRCHRGKANVKIVLSNNEATKKKGIVPSNSEAPNRKDDAKQQNHYVFKVASVEIRPCTGHNSHSNMHYFSSLEDSCPWFRINNSEENNTQISRISAATEADRIAFLRVTKDNIHVGVFDFDEILNQSSGGNSFAYDKKCMVEVAQIKRDYDFNPGLSLSPDGRQLTVFEEPQIGDWKDGEDIGCGNFGIKLYNIPEKISSMSEAKTKSKFDTLIKMDDSLSHSEAAPNIDLYHSEAASSIELFRSFIGFAKFLPARKIPPHAAKDTEYSGLFAACNGVYLDIFDCSPER
ncbi:hypothetical protein BGX27_002726 [Mortierella sp. AM989]|nr:hypothetical protein BGX27_002726 [Mortierella sp. AM989]